MIPHSRPTVLEIDLKRVVENYRVLKNLVSPARCMAVVKANAYGHGLIEVAKVLQNANVDYLGVALVEEGVALRRAGITAPIHVFGGILSEQVDSFFEFDLEATASSIDKLLLLNERAKTLQNKAQIHLKIDTGMGRLGVRTSSARSLFEAALAAEHCVIRGIFSHLAAAEASEPAFTELQIERFNECQRTFQSLSTSSVLFHLANSAGAIKFPESRFDMVRCGLALYGVNPVPTETVSISPALTLKSKIVYFKVVEAGTPISYGCTWVAPKKTRIVTVPIGYGDGFFRSLSNKGEVLIRGKRYPIVGKVCMDQMMVAIGNDQAFNGDEVILIGSQGNETITVEEIASLADTVEHEVFTSTNLRVPRIFLGEG